MPTSEQLNSVINFAISGFVITGVAAVMSRAMSSPKKSLMTVERHSIPWEAKKKLIDKYGLWAVNMAEQYCPHNDEACVEREAKRFYEVFTKRRS